MEAAPSEEMNATSPPPKGGDECFWRPKTQKEKLSDRCPPLPYGNGGPLARGVGGLAARFTKKKERKIAKN